MYKFETNKQRSKIMKSIRSSNTKSEDKLAKLLWHKGIRYRRNYKKLPGVPDIAITKYRIVVFIDGEFWHGYNWGLKKNKIKSNRDYWIPKIEKNMQRDKNNNEILQDLGWKVIRFWDSEVKKNVDVCVNTILSEIKLHNKGIDAI